MLVFGHTGMALGTAVLLAGVFTGGYFSKGARNQTIASTPGLPQSLPHSKESSSHQASTLSRLAGCIDIRLLLIGSLLPDIIDKPLGQFFFRDTLSNGRIFCHTLLFLITVTLIGLWLYRRYTKNWLLVLAFGILTHLVFDQMWRSPRTLLWPIYGLFFEMMDLTEWVPNMFYALLTDPQVYVPELVGAAVLVWFVVELVRRKKVFAFVKSGQVH